MSSPSLFWRLQIGGWLGFAVVALPLKMVFFGSVGRAVLATLYREPLGFVLSLGLRWVYRRLQAAGETPAWQLGCWAVAVSTGAGAIDWGAAEILDLSNNLKVPHALGAFGLFWFRSLTYLTWSVFYFWIKGQIAAREQALKLIRIKAAAQESELLMLRAQVNPHFLFNALNTVLAGLDSNPKALTPVVQGLADYLHYSLATRHAASVTLAREYEAVINYLVVEQARFRTGLQVEARLDEAARHLAVPGVMLQPLVENAVKHGYRSSPVPLRLRIVIRSLPAGGVLVEVANSGRWIEPAAERRDDDPGGVGLASLRRRLDLIYGPTHQFTLLKLADEVVVQLRLPPAPPSLAPA